MNHGWPLVKASGLVALCLSPALALCGESPGKVSPSHYLGLYIGRSKLILGTDEVREGVGAAYGFGRANPRLRIGGVPAQLVHTIHVMRGYGEVDRDIATSVGYEAVARYRFRTNGKVGAYMDVGWGLEYTDRLSPDIDSHWNSSPMLAAGVAIKQPAGEVMIGLGWYHVSNGGTHKPNLGQNYIMLVLGFRY
jgi:opacity protein-like surface antigen